MPENYDAKQLLRVILTERKNEKKKFNQLPVIIKGVFHRYIELVKRKRSY